MRNGWGNERVGAGIGLFELNEEITFFGLSEVTEI